jgi:hypothetical protein
MILGRVFFKMAWTGLTILIMFSCSMLMIENKYFIRPCLAQKAANYHTSDLFELFILKICPSKPYVFHVMLYYFVVTLTTCGFGDITPKTTPGMMMLIFCFASTVIILA